MTLSETLMHTAKYRQYGLLADLGHTLSEVRYAVSMKRSFLENLSELRELREELSRVESAAMRASDQVFAMLDTLDETGNHKRDPLGESDVQALGKLDRQLVEVSRFLRERAAELNPVMQAKVEDPADPLVDYEILARIDYILHDEDPEYDGDDDTILTTREESLKGRHRLPDREIPFGTGALPDSEPCCWLFHDLHDHSAGLRAPALALRDCLRIGKIFIDVQVWHQYAFDLDKNEWTKRRNGGLQS